MSTELQLVSLHEKLGALMAAQTAHAERMDRFETDVKKQLNLLMVCSKSNRDELVRWAAYRKLLVGLVALGLFGWGLDFLVDLVNKGG